MSRTSGLEIGHLKVEKPPVLPFKIALPRDTSTVRWHAAPQQEFTVDKWRVQGGDVHAADEELDRKCTLAAVAGGNFLSRLVMCI